MHQQFNIQQLYVLPTLYLCVLYLSENKQRLGFYNRDEKCLLRGTNWVFNQSSLRFVFKRLTQWDVLYPNYKENSINIYIHTLFYIHPEDGF